MALSWPSDAFRGNPSSGISRWRVFPVVNDALGNLSSGWPNVYGIVRPEMSIVMWIVSAIAFKDSFISSVLQIGTAMLLKNRSLVERNCSASPEAMWMRMTHRGAPELFRSAPRFGDAADLKKLTPELVDKAEPFSTPTSKRVKSHIRHFRHPLTRSEWSSYLNNKNIAKKTVNWDTSYLQKFQTYETTYRNSLVRIRIVSMSFCVGSGSLVSGWASTKPHDPTTISSSDTYCFRQSSIT